MIFDDNYVSFCNNLCDFCVTHEKNTFETKKTQFSAESRIFLWETDKIKMFSQKQKF